MEWNPFTSASGNYQGSSLRKNKFSVHNKLIWIGLKFPWKNYQQLKREGWNGNPITSATENYHGISLRKTNFSVHNKLIWIGLKNSIEK